MFGRLQLSIKPIRPYINSPINIVSIAYRKIIHAICYIIIRKAEFDEEWRAESYLLTLIFEQVENQLVDSDSGFLV